MRQYIIRRLLLAIPVLLLLTLAVFLLIRVLPGNVVEVQAAQSGRLGPAEIKRLSVQLGLDKPLPVQYLQWLGGVLHGDLGQSMWSHEPVWASFRRTFPVTFELSIFGMLVGTLVGIPLGVLSAIYRNSLIDYCARLVAIVGLSIPQFWLGTLLVVFPALWFHYHPPLGFASLWSSPRVNLQQVMFPVIVLGFALSAGLMRFTRSGMLEVLHEDYIRTARSKGLRAQSVVLRHALKNTLIPVLTVMGDQLGVLIGGTVVIEALFFLPGLGQLTYTSISNRDYTVVQGNILLFGAMLILINIAVDLGYSILDPRVRFS